MRPISAAVAAAALLLTLAACNAGPETPDAHRLQTSLPADEVTVLADEQPHHLALGVSRALFDRAEVVVLAGADDHASHEEAAAAATGIAAPLLLTPPEGTDESNGSALRDELDRLEVQSVWTIGQAAEQWAEDLDDTSLVALTGPAGAPTRRPVAAPEPLPDLAVLTNGGDHTLAATTTARAAGAQVLVTDAGDPRADPELISYLAQRPPTHTIALGATFGSADQLHRRLAVATTGIQLPGGGQLVFPGRRLVALYGHPGDSRLGALGEQPLDEAVTRAQEVAAEYEELVNEPVIPTFEIITTIASSSPGPEGDYSTRTDPEQLQPWIDAAGDAGIYVVLDLQPGHTDFLTQAQEYEQLLREPHVGLALDPEWRLAPDQRHMVNIGSVDGEEVNEVVDWLAQLTAEHRLPQKLLIVHQFTLGMFTDRSDVDLTRDEVAVLIHADGFGTPAQKMDTWDALRRDAPDVWWGWKNFYDEDDPTFTPAETIDVEPSPLFISYQ